jgi:outer membrane protein
MSIQGRFHNIGRIRFYILMLYGYIARFVDRFLFNAVRSAVVKRLLLMLAVMRTGVISLLMFVIVLLTGCVSDEINDQNNVVFSYQQTLADQGPQQRVDTEGKNMAEPLGLLEPVSQPESHIPKVEFFTDPNTGEQTVSLTIEQALARMLENSPEIRVVSFDPSIAKQDVTRAASEFDVTAFGDLNYENEDNPSNSIFQPGQSNSRSLETGVKQKSITGSEWSLSYNLTRTWDDLTGRTLSTRYEPILGFQLKQPLLRDAWQQVTLAGVDVAKLNYRVALLDFRQKAEGTAVGLISAYWQLLQAQRNYQIYQGLLDRTLETLERVVSRREIDATELHIKQTEASVKTREAALIQAKKQMTDAQDVLVRLMADVQLNLLNDFKILPASEPLQESEKFDYSQLLDLAMNKNPVIQQARIGIEIADINIRVAENQDMPRLDLITSARTQNIARSSENANERLSNLDYLSYRVGLSLEYPLGNRQREAELIQRRFERRKAVSVLQNVADQAAQLIRERARRAETNYTEIQVQKDAVKAAQEYLQALKEAEEIQEQLTPEFLLVKLQAQEVLADAQMSEIRAIVDFNIALAELAQTLGTVFELHPVQVSVPNISDSNDISE